MKGEAEEPAGHLLTSTPLVFDLGKLGENMRNCDVFITGQFMILPPHLLRGHPSVKPISVWS